MIFASYIITMVGLVLLLAGQFIWLAPTLACFSAFLWWQLLIDKRVYRMPMLWLCLGFIALIAVQIINAGSFERLANGNIGLNFPANTLNEHIKKTVDNNKKSLAIPRGRGKKIIKEENHGKKE